MDLSKNNSTHQPRCYRNPTIFFKHVTGMGAGVIIGDLIAGFMLHRCFSPKLSNILAGFIIAVGYSAHCVESDYQKQVKLNGNFQCTDQTPTCKQ